MLRERVPANIRVSFVSLRLNQPPITLRDLNQFLPARPLERWVEDYRRQRIDVISEIDRLSVLEKLSILNTEQEQYFEDLVDNVRDILGVPVAVISLVGREEQWFKAVRGLPVCSTEREVAFCATAMYEPHGLAVSDARNDERFESNRLVRGEPGIRSYLGAPLIVHDNVPIGALAGISFETREWKPAERTLMRRLARQTAEFIEMRGYHLAAKPDLDEPRIAC
ncbi:MAG: hypothetical protein CMK06_00515 [Ponticaulis sp.]|nr:hypothetical protein [Ponticaulis sp.]